MAMLALTGAECDEILAYLRASLPDVDDALLQELAGNFGLDALADIDPADVQGLLAVPGPRIMLRGSIQGELVEDVALGSLFPDFQESEVDLTTVASALLVTKTPPTMKRPLAMLSRVLELMGNILHPGATVASPLYRDNSLPAETSTLRLVLSGVGTHRGFLDARWRENLTLQKLAGETPIDVPAFLRSRGDD